MRKNGMKKWKEWLLVRITIFSLQMRLPTYVTTFIIFFIACRPIVNGTRPGGHLLRLLGDGIIYREFQAGDDTKKVGTYFASRCKTVPCFVAVDTSISSKVSLFPTDWMFANALRASPYNRTYHRNAIIWIRGIFVVWPNNALFRVLH